MLQHEVRHDGLKKHRVLRATDQHELRQRAAELRDAWEAQWQRVSNREEQRLDRERRADGPAEKSALADALTTEAAQAVAALKNTLRSGLGKTLGVDWERLKGPAECPVPRPKAPEKPVYPPKPDRSFIPPKPEPIEPEFGLLDSLLPFQKDKKRRDAAAANRLELEAWKQLIEEFNQKVANYNERVAQINQLNQEVAAEYKTRLKEWHDTRARYEAEWQARSARIDALRDAYKAGDPEAVLDYCDRILADSEYPEAFPHSYSLEYRADSRTLRVEYDLPPLEQMPSVQSVRFNQAWDIFEETELPDESRTELHEALIDQIVVRTVHELFAADRAQALDAIEFQGFVDVLDPATEQPTRTCAVRVRAGKEAFQAVNMEEVEPRACLARFQATEDAPLERIA